MVQTISHTLSWWARNQPDTVALAFGPDKLSYRDLHDWSERVAVYLEQCGLQDGDRVGICAANSMAYCALIMGTIRAGGIVASINPRLTAREIGETVEDTAPTLVFADPERQAVLVTACQQRSLDAITALRTGDAVRSGRDLNPDQAVVIIATSGSTARPKGVVYSHRTMLSYASGFAIEEPQCVQGAKVIVLAPLATSAGFVQLIHYTMLGNTIYMEAAFEPERALEMIVSERINLFGAVPVFFERIAACKGFAQADLSCIRLATVGGARVSKDLQDQWQAKGIVLRQIYGQTEAGGNATIMSARLAAAHPEQCGRGGVFTELAILGEDGNHCPPGKPGEILVRGPGVMVGYWNNPEATAATLKNSWLHTGDQGVLDEAGNLTFLDRLKDIIISGGMNISSAELERVISEFPGIEEVAVISAPDERFGETPMAIVHGTGPVSVPDLVAHCNAVLADYKVPRYIVVEPEPLPRLATGKLSKPLLRARYPDPAKTLAKVR